MEITLEKIELVKDRTGVSYKEAKEALEAAGGNVVDAIIDIEESIDEKGKGKFSEQGTQLIDKLKELVKKGNVSKILVKKEDEIILNLPVNIGILGTVIAPIPMVIAAIAAFGTKCVVEVVKDDGSIIDVSEIANEALEDVIEKGAVLADEVKVKGADVYQNVKTKTADALNKVKKDECDEGCCCDDECDDDCVCDEEKCNCGCGCGCDDDDDDNNK